MPQVVGHVPRRRESIRSSFGKRLEANAVQLLRNGVVHLPGGTSLDKDDLVEQLSLRVRLEGPSSRQQLVEDHAQTEDVAAAIDPMTFASRLFGTHVGRRPGIA